MAISIDRVYQKVLAFANKEQRGYITPQEFNLFADQAQMEIFEQYFYDINQWTRQHGNSHEYGDMLVNLEEKIDRFAHIAIGDNVTVLNKYGDINLSDDLPDLYRLGSIRVKYPETSYVTAEEIRSRKEFVLYDSSPLTKRTRQRPIYHRHSHHGNDRIKIYPYPVEDDGSDINLSTDEIDLNAPHVTITGLPFASDSVKYGRYAEFDLAEMDAMLGSSYTHPQYEDLVIVRNGEILTTHKLKLFHWQYAVLSSGYLRRHPYTASSVDDWQDGDLIFASSDIFQDDQRNVQIDYIRKPKTPSWGYVVVSDKALYNSTSSTHFELHPSEESELVYRILAFAGIAIEKPQLTQVAAGLEQAKVQQEKQ